METLENLSGNNVLITAARKVRGGKIQLTFAQKVQNPNSRPQSIVGMLNKSDERFTQSGKPRYAWIGGELADIKAAFPSLDLSGLDNEGDSKSFEGVEAAFNPEINGKKLNIQITEVTTPNEYEAANLETAAKKAGAEGEFILTPKGEHIFVRSTVVAGEPKHVFIADTMRESEYAAQAAQSEADSVADSAIDDELGA